jgi:hypothetical protein
MERAALQKMIDEDEFGLLVGATTYFYHEIEDLYEETLTNCYEDIDICGLMYGAGHALRLVDDTAFRCGCNEWCSEEFKEIKIDGREVYVRKQW